jgi:peroxiredoxin family protein
MDENPIPMPPSSRQAVAVEPPTTGSHAARDVAQRGDPMDEPLNLILFSGTDDRLQAAAVLTAGAAALGKPVNIFLQYWALDAFRSTTIGRDHGLAPEAGPAGRAAVDALARAGQVPWAETFRQAKGLGAVDIQACSLSMDLLNLESTDLDPLVDGVEGVTAFYLNAGEGQVVFI